MVLVTAPMNLDVLVVGGGIAGLATAISCAEKGFNVTILESSAQFSHVGAGLMISANATRILVDQGLREELDNRSTVTKRELFISWDGKKLLKDTTFDRAKLEEEYGAPNWQIHRADLHTILLNKAQSLGVKIEMGTKVKNYNWDAPAAVLEDGTVKKADVILAADGYRSRARSEMLGRPSEPRASGNSAYRVVIPRAAFENDPEFKHVVNAEQQITHAWVGDGKHIVAYPIRKGEYFNIATTQPAVHSTGDKFVVPIKPEQVQACYAAWDPLLVKILAKLPEEGILEWRLCDLPPMETWLFPGGKIALLGDACHPMLPSAAQGAGMGIEDGAAVAELLARATDKSQIPAVLKAWEALRLPRCSDIVNMGRRNAARWHGSNEKEHVGPVLDNGWLYDVRTEAKKFPLDVTKRH